MTNLDLNAFGVEEMTEVQMAEIEGGILPVVLLVAGLFVCQALY